MRRQHTEVVEKVPVSLKFETQGYGYDRTQEPQTVKVRSQNRARFYLSLQNPITSLEGVFTTAGAQRVKRLAVTRVKANVCLVNVNAANNVIYYSASPRPFDTVYDSTFAITLPIGFFTPADFVAAFVAAFNAQVNPAVASIQATQIGTTGVYQLYTYRVTTLSSLQGSFINSFKNTVQPIPTYSDKDGVSTALNNPWGLGLAGINFSDANPVYGSAYNWIYPQAYGVRYFDICSTALTMDSKTMNPDLNAPGNSIARVFLESPLPHIVDKTWEEPLNWINVEDRPITSIDLRIALGSPYQMVDTGNYPNGATISRVNVDVEVTIEF